MEQNAKGPAETIVSTLTSFTDHLVHNRPGIVVPDARANLGVRWEPVTHKEEDGGEKVIYRLVKVGNKTQRQRVGVMGLDKVVRDGNRVVGRYQPAGIFPEAAQWMYQQVAEVWKLDNEFAARWASYAFNQDHRDLKVVLAAFMLVQSRKGDPVKDGNNVRSIHRDHVVHRILPDKSRGRRYLHGNSRQAFILVPFRGTTFEGLHGLEGTVRFRHRALGRSNRGAHTRI